MKKYICSLLCLLLGAAGLASAQSPDAVPAQGTIEIQVRGIPADDATAISGQYLLDGNGTIRMPQLPPGHDVLRVVGKTARQIEDMLMAAYKKAELYTAPTFLVKVQSSDARLTEHIVLVSGGVAMKKNVLWRRDASGSDCGRGRHYGLGFPVRAGDARRKNRDVRLLLHQGQGDSHSAQ